MRVQATYILDRSSLARTIAMSNSRERLRTLGTFISHASLYPLPGEVQMLSVMPPANAYCSGAGKRTARIRAVARTVSWLRRIIGRAMELVNGHESSLAVSNRGASLNP